MQSQSTYLASINAQFLYYKQLAEKTINQLPNEKLFWQYNEESNSIATIIKHLVGNMLSRWTDFLTTDGEKPWRNRESEFENDITTKEQLMELWEKGWACMFDAINPLNEADLEKEIFIRNQGHTIIEAINRQLAHYPYHIGQIVFIGKMICNNNWKSLSIPKGNSEMYNNEKFAEPKTTKHFTSEYINEKK